MGKERKQTKFRNFIDKAKKVLPDIAAVGGKLAAGNYLGAISEVGQILTGKADAEPNNEKVNALLYEFELSKIEFGIEEERIHQQDRKRATDLYKHDANVQKILTFIFTFIYLTMTILILYGFYKIGVEKVELPNYVVAFVSTLYTGLSMKINTIVDFFFGSSTTNKTQQHEKD